MTAAHRSRIALAVGIPALIFTACALITFSAKFKAHPDQLSVAVILDLVLVAPFVYFLAIRKTTISKLTTLRVFISGVLFAGLILSKSHSPLLGFIKTWMAPVAELSLVGFIVWKFYIAKKQVSHSAPFDFLMQCRALLRSVFGSEKTANAIASEVAVFYYTFGQKEKNSASHFTSYKKNGIIIVLNTFLCLFVLETVGMHFVFQLWNKTAAWILTGLSIYTCMQLYAHIRAMKTRPNLITDHHLIVRHGLMGGDAVIAINNIERLEETSKLLPGKDTVKIAFIKGLEKHSVAIHLKEPVKVIKGFGIQKTAKTILLSIDTPKEFAAFLNLSLQNQSDAYPHQQKISNSNKAK